MHTLMAREHNRLASGLSEVNPHWDDETLFQEARRINIATIQHITYNEFLPIVLGKEVMEKFGLLTQKEGYWDGYDATVNPAIIDSFASAAFRFGHTLVRNFQTNLTIFLISFSILASYSCRKMV